jgi:ubiquinone/menaquinone biosynthesis C-methylase UbiE
MYNHSILFEDLMSAFIDLFSNVADNYARYRPLYPQALADYLAGISPAQETGVDCGCGSGQFSRLLATRFKQVHGVDGSIQQISQAPKLENVTFHVAPVEATGLSSGVADIVTAATAAHWFDLPRFYKEVRRLLKPGGVIALICYTNMRITPEIDAITDEFYGETVGPYWPPQRQLIETGYRYIDFPFQELQPPDMHIETEWEMMHLVGYLRTWSATQGFEKAHGVEALKPFVEKLQRAWGDPQKKRKAIFPLAMRIGRI